MGSADLRGSILEDLPNRLKTIVPALSESALQALRAEYFADDTNGAFMIVDGASVPDLIDRLYDDEAAFSCLLSGELEPDMQEVAPYLVELRDGDLFSDWALANGFGGHWGIGLRSSLSRAQLLRRFRQLLFVRDPQGEPLYFRFYDPRVLRAFLPTCQGQEIWPWLDNIDCYLIEGETPGLLLRVDADEERIRVREIAL
jgi:hypothetical protein